MTSDHVLIVDDREENLYLLNALLRGHGFAVTSAENGAEALEAARREPPDLVIADILMPVMDGFALCRAWKQDELLGRIPFIFYTATYTDERDKEFALSLGAERFIVKPVEPDILLAAVRETLVKTGSAGHAAALGRTAGGETPDGDESGYLRQYNQALVRKLEAKMQQLELANRRLEADVAARKRAEEETVAATHRMKMMLKAAVAALGATIELRDPYTAGHQRRVSELAAAIARELAWDEAGIDNLMTASLLHDIGKIIVPAEILTRPGTLSAVELELVRQHSAAGANTVSEIDAGGTIADVIRQHHERLDGSGYPDGLHGSEILPAARVLAVADVVEAMVSHRPYRAALPLSEAIAEIRDGLGGRYDDEVAAACLRLLVEEGFEFSDGDTPL